MNKPNECSTCSHLGILLTAGSSLYNFSNMWVCILVKDSILDSYESWTPPKSLRPIRFDCPLEERGKKC